MTSTMKKNISPLPPRTKWIGGANHGVVPIATTIMTLDPIAKGNGLHVMDTFAGIYCGGLQTVLEAGYKDACYTSVEIDDISRVIARINIE